METLSCVRHQVLGSGVGTRRAQSHPDVGTWERAASSSQVLTQPVTVALFGNRDVADGIPVDQAGPEFSARRPHKKRVIWTETHGRGRVTTEVAMGVMWPQAQSEDSTPRSGGKRQEGPSGAFGEVVL